MGYPGDQSQSGGRPPEQPSQPPPPYAPGQGPPADPAPGSSGDPATGPFPAPPPGLGRGPEADPYRPADQGEPDDPFAAPGPYGNPYGGPYAGSHEGFQDLGYNPPGSYNAQTPYNPGAAYNPGSTPYEPPPGYEPQPAYQPGGPYDPDDPNGGGPPAPERSRLPLVIGAIVGAIVIVGGGVMIAGSLGSDPAKKTASGSARPQQTGASNAPTSPSAKPTPTAGPLGAKLKSRTTDPRALALSEVFKRHRFGKYVLTAQRQDRNCAKVVHGARFAAVLKAGHCTQLLRATFTTTNGKLIGTIGVANLATATAARKAQSAGAGKDAWLLPLPGSGTTKKIGKGSALGTTEARGHYLLLSWVQRPDGKDLPTSQRGTVSTFVSQVILGSNLGTALQYRGISGKPYGT